MYAVPLREGEIMQKMPAAAWLFVAWATEMKST